MADNLATLQDKTVIKLLIKLKYFENSNYLDKKLQLCNIKKYSNLVVSLYELTAGYY